MGRRFWRETDDDFDALSGYDDEFDSDTEELRMRRKLARQPKGGRQSDRDRDAQRLGGSAGKAARTKVSAPRA